MQCVFLKLERAARRENDARLLGSGLSMLSRLEGHRIVASLGQHPERLFRAAKSSWGRRQNGAIGNHALLAGASAHANRY
jgi:hypothetical protein